ncbi:hypothetical protein ABPG75_007458 [Micractinium tetrahymenae]
MQELAVYAACTPPALGGACRASAAPKPAAGPQIVEDKENFLPSGTPPGGPLHMHLASCMKGLKGQQEKPARRALADVTHHYAAASKSIAVGALGGSFGLPLASPTTCSQEAAAAAAAAAMEAAAAAKRQAAKRQALRAMR